MGVPGTVPISRQRTGDCPGNDRAHGLPSPEREGFSRKDHSMLGPVAAYVVAFFAMLFSALSALTLIYTLRHFD
jgi:hypothetical protein